MTTRIEEEELELAVRSVLASPRATEFVWWILEQCGVYSAPHVVNGETGIHIGRRIVGVSIINKISEIDPKAYPRMMLEALDRAEMRKRIENEKPSDE